MEYSRDLGLRAPTRLAKVRIPGELLVTIVYSALAPLVLSISIDPNSELG